MSTEVNPVLSAAEDAFKSGIWDTLINSEIDALCASSGFLAFFKPVIKAIVKLCGNWLFSKIRIMVDVSAIRLMDAKANAAFRDASIALSVVMQEKGMDSDEYKKAKADAQAALSTFTRFNQ